MRRGASPSASPSCLCAPPTLPRTPKKTLHTPVLRYEESPSPTPSHAAPSALKALAAAALESLSVFAVFFTCLSTFPGLTTSLTSTSWHLGSWFPIVLVAAYNAADLIGKTLPSHVRIISSVTLPWCALAHTLFVPAFLWLARPPWMPAWLLIDGGPPDWLVILIVLALGLGTGYIGCMALVLGAERGNTPEEREALGMVTSFALMIGLSTGSTAGLGLSQLVLG